MIDLESLAEIAYTEYSDIVVSAQIVNQKLRVTLADGSYIDFRWSITIIPPHSKWKSIKTFPLHFHSGSDSNVIESKISLEPDEAVREFLTFARQKLSEM